MKNLERLRPLLESFVKNGPAGCALMVTHKGEMVYEDYVGLADRKSARPIGPNTIYRLASMTKVVASVAGLILYERGAFLLNDPLSDYLPAFADAKVFRTDAKGHVRATPAKSPILMKHLFTMASGFVGAGNNSAHGRAMAEVTEKLAAEKGGPRHYTIQEYMAAIADVPLAFDPGTHWEYGMGLDILSAVIEVISGKTFGQFLKDEIFDPLGMKSTFFVLPEDRRDDLCTLYHRQEDGTLVLSDRPNFFADPESRYESASGGLLSTLGDYSRFAACLAAGGELDGVRILGRKTIELMSTNHLNETQLADFDWPYQAGYGYGLGVRTMMDRPAGGSNGSLKEFGWCGFMGTWVLIDPAEELTAVYMQQMIPNFEAFHQPRLRAVIYGCLE